MNCDRCGRETTAFTMSFFDTEEICMACQEKEQAHPDYELARSAEAEAVAQGDYNYPGIGKPKDL